MKITIELTDYEGWAVTTKNERANKLSWDEMMGLVSSLTMPDNRPCRQWLEPINKEEGES